jgi:hypothetical protein
VPAPASAVLDRSPKSYPPDRYLSVDTTEVDVRRDGTTGIVRCAQRSHASWRGEEMRLAVRISQVWIRHPDGWRLVALQFSTSLSQSVLLPCYCRIPSA